MQDFKTKRIEYINNWPNVDKFDIEARYEEKYKSVNNGIPFIPYHMTSNTDEFYNKAISFLIDALESLGSKPNHSFEFIFTAFDIYSQSVSSIDRITDRNWSLVPVWNSLIQSDSDLNIAFGKLMENIPHKSLQYIFSRILDSRIANRSAKNSNGTVNVNRSNLLNQIKNKYSTNYADYSTGIRPGSRLLYHVLNKHSIVIDGITYSISLEDQLHIIISGFLYSLRNDTAHGSSISTTKSSYSNMTTMANSYFAFLMTYYFLLLLIIDNTSTNKPQASSDLAQNIEVNVNNYILLFGHALSK